MILTGLMTEKTVFAGCPVTVLPNDNSTSGNCRAPSTRYNNARVVYLIKATEMATAGYLNGMDVGSIGWNYNTAPNTSGSAPLIVYLQNTSDVTNLKSTTWSTAISGMTTVHNATTTVPSTAGTFDIPFSGGSAFTYTGGGVYVAFEWGCYSGALSTTAVVWCNSTGLSSGLKGAQIGTGTCATPGTLAASSFRPETRFATTGGCTDAAVSLIYTLGSIPTGYVASHAIQAHITNPGTSTLTSLNVTLNVTGANTLTDVQTIASLAPGAAADVTFASYPIGAIGTNTITVSVPGGDANSANDSKTMTQNITANTYSYRYPGVLNTGGVGFTNGTGSFVGKFNTSTGGDINEVQVDFTTTNLPYKLGIYGDDGTGRPGALLYTDANDRLSAIGTAYLTLATNVTVPAGNFYIGIRQTGTTNIGFAFTSEVPIRNDQFYFTSPLPEPGFWQDLNADESGPGLDFRFNITVNFHIPVPPNCVVNLTPNEDYPICPGGTTIDWVSNGGAPTSYDVYFDTNPSPAFVTNTTDNFYSTGALAANTTYYYQIVAKNSDGNATGCSIQSFTTGDNLNCYCVPANFGCGNGDITNVEIGTINNTTGCSGDVAYSAFSSAITTDLQIGTTPNLSVTTDQSCIVSVWVDWDQDLFFESSEMQTVTLASTTGVPSSISLNIPLDALEGITVMRIRSRLTNNADTSACEFFGSGEAEDYRVNVTAPDVSWGGLSVDYCINSGATQLFPTTPGGIFSGPGVSFFGFGIYIFTPADAGVGGPYTITYTIGAYSSSQTTTVHDLPVVTLTPYADVCETGAAFTLTGGSPEGGFYTVDENGAEVFDPAISGPGVHTITYYYFDGFGCANTASQTINVSSAIEATITPDATVTFCQGSTAMLSASPSGLFYQWYRNGVLFAGQTNEVSNVTNNGTYSVVVTNGACSSTSAGTSAVRLKAGQANITAIGSLDICLTGAVTLKVTSGTVTYQWSKGGIPISGATNQLYIATGTGDYTATITSTINGCTKTSAVTTVYTTCKLADVGIQESAMSLYPNPTSNNFFVELNTESDLNLQAQIQILNTLGQVVYSNFSLITDGKLMKEINFTENYSAGNYLVRIIAGNKVFNGNILYQR